MSVIDVGVLRAMGVRPTGLRVPIPLYMRTTLVDVRSGGVAISRSVQHDMSYQQIAALLLEVPDFYQFRKYVYFVVFKRKNNKILVTREIKQFCLKSHCGIKYK